MSSLPLFGAVGAAAITGVALGVIDGIDIVGAFIPAVKTFVPDISIKPVYDRNYEVFKKLYKSNKSSFKALNAMSN
jgi:xylulokinase